MCPPYPASAGFFVALFSAPCANNDSSRDEDAAASATRFEVKAEGCYRVDECLIFTDLKFPKKQLINIC
jgi:hypothetical protein